MIKKVHYTQLALLILLLFVLFQMTSISITFDEITNDFGNYSSNSKKNKIKTDSTESILLVTGKQTAKADHIEQELLYLRKGYQVTESLLTIPASKMKNVDVIILASDSMSGIYDINLIEEYMKQGINIILAVMPQVTELNDDWQVLLGIKSLEGTKEQKGITVLSGFLLGGKYDYKDYKLEVNNIKVASTCKTFISGIGSKDEGKTIKYGLAEDKKATDIVWRNIYEGSQIFIVNGAFFDDNNGSGILTAIFSELYENFIYPVINSKALLINNAPYLTSENDAEMKKRYARNPQRFFEDIALPQIIGLCMTTDNIPTFYAVSSLDESQATADGYIVKELSIVNSELNRIGGRLGISVFDRQDVNLAEKTLKAMELFKNELGDYDFDSLFIKTNDKSEIASLVKELGDSMSIKSLITSWKEGATYSFYDNNILNIPVITEGYTFSDEDLFTLNSTATAFGVISHGIDMDDIIYPESDEQDWSKAFVDFTSGVDTYWADYQYLDSMNMTEVYNRVNSFLSITPNIIYKNDQIQISIDGFNKQAYFILHTDKEIKDITNGTSRKIEDGVYLISALNKNVEIKLK